MSVVWDLITQNLGFIIGVILSVLILVLGDQRRKVVNFLSETAFFAWHRMEHYGLFQGLTGNDKLTGYLSIAQEAYFNKFEKEMDDKTFNYFVNKAKELSETDKVRGTPSKDLTQNLYKTFGLDLDPNLAPFEPSK